MPGHGNKKRPMEKDMPGHGNREERPMEKDMPGHGNKKRPMEKDMPGHGNKKRPMEKDMPGHGNKKRPMEKDTPGEGNREESQPEKDTPGEDPRSLSSGQLATLLQENEMLEDTINRFAENKINGSLFIDSFEDIVEALGITNKVELMKLMSFKRKIDVQVSVTGMTGGQAWGSTVIGINYGGMGNVNVIGMSEDTIGKLKESTARRIDKMTKGMTKVSSIDLVLGKLQEEHYRWITITGCPGEGKTTLGYLVLKRLREEGREVFVVGRDEPEKIDDVSERGCVVMLDDTFGSFQFDSQLYKRWAPKIEMLLGDSDKVTQDSDEPQVIFISRRNVMERGKMIMEKIEEQILNKSTMVDLSEEKRDKREKIQILTNHLEQKKIEIHDDVKERVVEKSSTHGFPHTCRIFVEIKSAVPDQAPDIEEFFVKPLRFLNIATRALAENNPECYALFKEMIVEDGRLDVSRIQDDQKRDTVTMGKKELLNSYLFEEDDSYVTFAHPSIYESVGQAVAEKTPGFFIDNAAVPFIRQTLNIYQHGRDKEEGYINMKLGDNLLGRLVERFKNDVLQRDINVFKTQMARNRGFCEKLVKAAFRSSTSAAEAGKIDINGKDPYGNTALLWCALFGTPASVKTLVQQGADVNVEGGFGRTVLHWLCLERVDVELIKWVIQEGRADRNVVDWGGQKPLHYLPAETQKEIKQYFESQT